MTTSQLELAAKNFTIEEKAKLISQYNGQTGTAKQVERVLKAYSTHEQLDRFIVPRWHVIKQSLG